MTVFQSREVYRILTLRHIQQLSPVAQEVQLGGSDDPSSNARPHISRVFRTLELAPPEVVSTRDPSAIPLQVNCVRVSGIAVQVEQGFGEAGTGDDISNAHSPACSIDDGTAVLKVYFEAQGDPSFWLPLPAIPRVGDFVEFFGALATSPSSPSGGGGDTVLWAKGCAIHTDPAVEMLRFADVKRLCETVYFKSGNATQPSSAGMPGATAAVASTGVPARMQRPPEATAALVADGEGSAGSRSWCEKRAYPNPKPDRREVAAAEAAAEAAAAAEEAAETAALVEREMALASEIFTPPQPKRVCRMPPSSSSLLLSQGGGDVAESDGKAVEDLLAGASQGSFCSPVIATTVATVELAAAPVGAGGGGSGISEPLLVSPSPPIHPSMFASQGGPRDPAAIADDIEKLVASRQAVTLNEVMRDVAGEDEEIGKALQALMSEAKIYLDNGKYLAL